MSVEEVDRLAQGRVWSGTDALGHGLIDELGGLDDAVAEAARLAEIESYNIRKYPKYKSDFQKFMENFGGASAELKESLLQQELGEEAYGIIEELRSVLKQKGIQARMPFTIKIQ